jgi:aromatic-L-amino-acid decarboxylase
MEQPHRSLNLTEGPDAALEHAARLVSKAWSTISDAPSDLPIDERLRRVFQESLPPYPMSFYEAIDDADQILEGSVAQARPRSLAFPGSGGVEVAVLADLLVQTYNIEPGVGGLGASALANQTLRWVSEFIGYPAHRGAFVSDALTCTVLAIELARDHALPGAAETGLKRDVGIYASSEARPPLERAARIMGIGSRQVRLIDVDSMRRMRPDVLEETMREDESKGVMPLAVIATVGTRTVGAVDPISEIADVCRGRAVWLHIDGSYGLPAAGAASKRHTFEALGRADSLALDAHKWLFVPKSCSVLLTSEEAADGDGDGESLSRPRLWTDDGPFQAMKLWLALRVFGAEKFRSAIEANLQQALGLYRAAQRSEDFEVLELPPELNVVPIRHAPLGVTEVNAHNRALAAAIRLDRRIDLEPIVIDGDDWLRTCFANFRTTQEDVQQVLRVARELGSALIAEGV